MDRYKPVPYLWGFFKTEHIQGEDLPKKLTKGQFMPGGGAFPLEHAWRTEPWRIVTPIFLHFSVIHLLFNMMTLWQFGPPIESSRGSWRFALLVVAIAVPSNVAQYLWSGPAFGGMSGVLYGLFGYLWMQSRYEWTSEFYVSRNMVIWMIGWSVMCVSGILGPIGNACHFAGLFVGMIIGRWPSYLALRPPISVARSLKRASRQSGIATLLPSCSSASTAAVDRPADEFGRLGLLGRKPLQELRHLLAFRTV